MAAQFGLSAEEREQVLPSGRQKLLHNRIHWARILENTPTFFEHVIVDLLVAMGYGGDRRSAARDGSGREAGKASSPAAKPCGLGRPLRTGTPRNAPDTERGWAPPLWWWPMEGAADAWPGR